MKKGLISLFKKEEGATAIEYGLIASLISVAIVAALLVLGPQLRGVFETVSGALSGS